jgi:hypothetical protein
MMWGHPRSVPGYVRHVEAFNHGLKVLITEVAQHYPNDAEVCRAQKRVMTALTFDPLAGIHSAGPYLYSYHKQIYALERPDEPAAAEAEAFFLNSEYAVEFEQSVDPVRVAIVKALMPKVKNLFRTCSADEKAQYQKLVIGLLDAYIEYRVEAPVPAGRVPEHH